MINISDLIFWNAIVGYSLIQSIVFSMLFVLKKGGDQFANLLLASLSFICTFILLEEFVVLNFGYESFPHLIYTAGPLWYLFAPLIYLYIRYYINRIKWRISDILHLVPFLYVLFSLVEFYQLPPAVKYQYHLNFIEEGKIASTHNLNYTIFLCQSFVYAVAGIVVIKFNGANKKTKNFSWLKTLSIGLVMFSFLALLMVWGVNINYSFFLFNSDLYIVLISIFIFILFYHSHNQGRILSVKIERSRVENRSTLEMQTIQNYLLEMKCYRNPKCNLQSIAEGLDFSKNRIKNEIKWHTGLTFREYINQFRVEDAKEELVKTENSIYTIESIARQVGFTSHATFYRIFRKIVGKTPGEFSRHQ